jgi:hypothetical protein
VVMPLAQETKKEIATIAIKDNTILLMILGFYGLKKEINKHYRVKVLVRGIVICFRGTITVPNYYIFHKNCKNKLSFCSFSILSCFI